MKSNLVWFAIASCVVCTLACQVARAQARPPATPQPPVLGAPPPGSPSEGGSKPPAKKPQVSEGNANRDTDGYELLIERYGNPGTAQKLRAAKKPEELVADGATVAAAQGKLRADLGNQRVMAAQSATVGPEQALEDTLQLAGQLVADRASARAFQLATDQLKKGFACGESSAAAAATSPPPLKFPHTCKVLDTLRLQDLATAPKLLSAALGADLISYVEDVFGGSPPPGIDVLIDGVLLPWAQRDARARTGQDVLQLIQGLVPANTDPVTDPAVQVGALATLAALQCVKAQAGCSLNDIIGQMCDQRECVKQENQIATVASDLFVALTENQPTAVIADVPGRIDASVAAITHLTCVDAAPLPADATGKLPDAEADCKAIAAADIAKIKPRWVGSRLTIRMRALVHAMIIEDGLGVGLAIGRFVDDAVALDATKSKDADYREAVLRATAITATLLNYTETYSGPNGMSNDARTAREQILQSLIDEFADRTRRDGAFIVSVGGSLRAAAGARLGSGSAAFYGPTSLVLGLGFDLVHKTSFHSEFGLVDLGEYVSFTSSGDHPFSVAKPTLRQAFSPSATFALSFAGPSTPLFVGAVVGASPFRDDKAKLRFYAGGAFGAYVSLFDLN